jgi:integrase
MGVKVRNRTGKWWVFVDHEGRRKAKCNGTHEAAEKVTRLLAVGELSVLGSENDKRPAFDSYADRWMKN